MKTPSHVTSHHQHVCPWWAAYTFDNPLRRMIHNPRKIFADLVKEGMTVMDVGCGMGYFSINMAKLTGPNGKVIAVDLQQKMLDVMLRRAARAGVADRISAHRCQADSLGISEAADFVLAFWMVHEVGDKGRFFRQLRSILKPGAKLLIAEPKMHVTAAELNETVQTALADGFQYCHSPKVALSRTALLKKS